MFIWEWTQVFMLSNWRERFNNKWHNYCTLRDMFKELTWTVIQRSYNFGYLSTDDRLKGNDTTHRPFIAHIQNLIYFVRSWRYILLSFKSFPFRLQQLDAHMKIVPQHLIKCIHVFAALSRKGLFSGCLLQSAVLKMTLTSIHPSINTPIQGYIFYLWNTDLEMPVRPSTPYCYLAPGSPSIPCT